MCLVNFGGRFRLTVTERFIYWVGEHPINTGITGGSFYFCSVTKVWLQWQDSLGWPMHTPLALTGRSNLHTLKNYSIICREMYTAKLLLLLMEVKQQNWLLPPSTERCVIKLRIFHVYLKFHLWLFRFSALSYLCLIVLDLVDVLLFLSARSGDGGPLTNLCVLNQF